MKTNYDEKQIYVRKWQNEDAGALLELGRDRKMKPYWKHSYPYAFNSCFMRIRFAMPAMQSCMTISFTVGFRQNVLHINAQSLPIG